MPFGRVFFYDACNQREAEIEPIKQTVTPHRENQMIDSYIEGSGQGKNPFLKMSTLSKFKVNVEETKTVF